MGRKLEVKDITLSEMPDRRNLKILFGDNAMVEMHEFADKTEIGKRPEPETNDADSWDIERLDRTGKEEEGVMDGDIG